MMNYLKWMSKRLFAIVSFLLFNLSLAYCQNTVDSTKIERPTEEYAQIFGLSFTRGIALAPSGSESSFAPINSLNSGTYGIGLSILLPPFRNSIKFKIQPQISWTVFNYSQEEDKLFPTSFRDTIAFDNEKQRITFVELPVGIVFLAKKDSHGDPIFFIEGGGFIGYRIGSAYKTDFTNDNDQEVKNKINNLENLRDFRAGIYGKLGYRWISLYYSFRLTNVFDQEVFENISYPNLPEMEIGFAIHL